jgi:hypothetical protein
MPLVEIAVRTLEISVALTPERHALRARGGDICRQRLARESRLDSDRVAAEHRHVTAKVNEFEGENCEKP